MTLKSKAKPLPLPSLDQDAAERKRVLNVLAQRRYRRKKKEQLQQLERAAKSQDSSCQAGQISPSAKSPTATVSISPCLTDPHISMYDQLQPSDFELPDFTGQQSEQDNDIFGMNSEDFMFDLPGFSSSSSNFESSTSSPDSRVTECVGLDETHLPMLELNLLRGAMQIAKRLNVDLSIWSLEALSPFNGSLDDFSHLPWNLQPTALQRQHPHHPALDILPWPTVRDKLILVFSQPLDLRPPNARTPLALVNFVYDLEDSAEGVRIWGDDPYSDQNWEIGQKLFENWWWALDAQVLARSNELRMNRGANLLGSDRIVEIP